MPKIDNTKHKPCFFDISMKKGKHFSKAEDDILRKQVDMYGEKNWEEVAKSLHGRNSLSCRNRYRIIKKRRREPEASVEEIGNVCSVYMYLLPIYVGQTTDTLENRDKQHRRSTSTYFDKQLGAMYPNAIIQLVDQKAFEDATEGKDWMDSQEFYYMMKHKTMRKHTDLGCNTNNARHWEASKKKLIARRNELVGELEDLRKKMEEIKDINNVLNH